MIKTSAALLSLTCLLACGSDPAPPPQVVPIAGSGGGNVGGTGGDETSGGTAGSGGIGGQTGGSGGAGGSAGSAGATAGCQMSATDAEQPMLLSETHCVDMTDPTKPAPGLIPYDVTSPLWSDGAVKERFVFIPAGSTIHVKSCTTEPDTCMPPEMGGSGTDEGHWDMPVGTVLVKNFSVGGKRIETRLLMQRNATTWKGFSYEWNDEGTDATRLSAELDKDLGTQVWHYPSSSQCLECHTKGAGRSLGPSTPQMNKDFAYADGTMNQIEKFASLGLFDTAPAMIAGFPDPYGTAPLEERVRSYFQTNCSICHRPGGTLSDIDFRFTTPYADMDLECAAIARGTGDPLLPQVRLVPGSPEESSLSFRMHDVTTYRMPRIGSRVVDMDAVQMVDDWITAMPAPAPDTCPPP